MSGWGKDLNRHLLTFLMSVVLIGEEGEDKGFCLVAISGDT